MGFKKKDTNEPIELPSPESAPKEQKAEEKEAVVNEIPQVPARKIQGEDGKIYNLITQNEAIQEILEGVREILNRTEE